MAFIHSRDLFFFLYGVGGSLNGVGKVKGRFFFFNGFVSWWNWWTHSIWAAMYLACALWVLYGLII